MTTRTFTNAKTEQTVTTDLSNKEIVERFAEVAPADSWMWFWLVKTIQERGGRNSAIVNVQAQNMADFVGDLFIIAVGRGLKRPMIRLGYREENRRYKIYLSQKGTVCIKGGNVAPDSFDPIGDEEYVGCLVSGGQMLAPRERTPTPADLKFLACLRADPVGFFIKCSKDMDRCCYCGKALEDLRSKDRGYGPVCAANWGLPWGDKRENQEVPSFAELWKCANPDDRRSVRAVCAGIRKDPADSLAWLALRDVLQEAGWPEERLPSQPERRVIVPRS